MADNVAGWKQNQGCDNGRTRDSQSEYCCPMPSSCQYCQLIIQRSTLLTLAKQTRLLRHWHALHQIKSLEVAAGPQEVCI